MFGPTFNLLNVIYVTTAFLKHMYSSGRCSAYSISDLNLGQSVNEHVKNESEPSIVNVIVSNNTSGSLTLTLVLKCFHLLLLLEILERSLKEGTYFSIGFVSLDELTGLIFYLLSFSFCFFAGR